MKEFKKNSFFEIFILRSWWVILLLLLGYVGYDQMAKKKNREIAELEYRLKEMEGEKKCLLEEKEDLLARLQSQEDPEWIERVLIKELGVVPKGQKKVFFKK